MTATNWAGIYTNFSLHPSELIHALWHIFPFFSRKAFKILQIKEKHDLFIESWIFDWMSLGIFYTYSHATAQLYGKLSKWLYVFILWFTNVLSQGQQQSSGWSWGSRPIYLQRQYKRRESISLLYQLFTFWELHTHHTEYYGNELVYI